MTFYAIPSLCAILVTVWLLWWGRSKFSGNSALVLLASTLLAMNLIEFTTFMLLDSPHRLQWLYQLYYAAAAITAAATVHLFLHLIGKTARYLSNINWLIAAVVAAMSLTPGVVIAGIENIGYTFIRIPGDLYNVWAVYIVSTLLFSVVLLAGGYRRSKDALLQRKCLAVLIAILPAIGCSIIIVCLMVAGVKVNATVVLSSAVIFFVVALIYSEQRYDLFKLLARVPFTEEYALRSELADQLRQIECSAFGGSHQSSFKEQIRKIEALYVDLAIVANNGNKTHAAAALGISNATLHRKATRKRQPVDQPNQSKPNPLSW